MSLLFAIFLVVAGGLIVGWALFLLLGWPGAALLGGVLLMSAGLIAIPIDRGAR